MLTQLQNMEDKVNRIGSYGEHFVFNPSDFLEKICFVCKSVLINTCFEVYW